VSYTPPLLLLSRLKAQARRQVLACGLASFALCAVAGQQDAPFRLTVTLLPGAASSAPTSGYCTTTNGQGSFGARVTVVCGTGAFVDLATPPQTSVPRQPLHGGAYRYVTQLSRAGESYGAVDVFGMAGTITTWRTVNLQDRSYTEMTVSW
jgi:hypothetical protein